jgi:hypothetical protein
MVQLGPGGTAERLAECRPAHVDDGGGRSMSFVRIFLLEHANCVSCRGDSKQDSGERRAGRNPARATSAHCVVKRTDRMMANCVLACSFDAASPLNHTRGCVHVAPMFTRSL